jgi:hypothetical protein
MSKGRGMLDVPQFTIVRDPSSERGVQAMSVSARSELARVNEAGGLLFATQHEAEQSAKLIGHALGSVDGDPQAPGTFAPGCVAGRQIYVPPLPETQFHAQFLEIVGDVLMDYGVTLLDVDREVGKRMERMVIELFKISSDPGAAIQNINTAMFWMFMIGREHAARGYAAPVPRRDSTGDGWVPENLADVFKKGADGGTD